MTSGVLSTRLRASSTSSLPPRIGNGATLSGVPHTQPEGRYSTPLRRRHAVEPLRRRRRSPTLQILVTSGVKALQKRGKGILCPSFLPSCLMGEVTRTPPGPGKIVICSSGRQPSVAGIVDGVFGDVSRRLAPGVEQLQSSANHGVGLYRWF